MRKRDKMPFTPKAFITHRFIAGVQAYWINYLIKMMIHFAVPTIVSLLSNLTYQSWSQLWSLWAIISQLQQTRSFDQLSQNSQSISAASQPSNITSQEEESTTAKKTINSEVTTQEDHKFNVVIYSIQECAKKTPRD